MSFQLGVVTHTCNPIERLKQEYLEFQTGLELRACLKQKVKLQTWKDYFCNPSILPFGRLKQEDDEFWGQRRFQRGKKKICEVVQSCYFWGNINRTIHPNQSLKKLYTKKTKEVGSSYWKKNEGVKQGKFLRVILTALAPKEKPICSFLGMCGCGSMHACACRYVYVRGKRTVSGVVPLTSDLGSVSVYAG